ncbi:MAG: tetratricopeptide repeat protein [Candidatus Sericytochromatia bacterium]|nr:tetratricopeptide repeat protein [Candidatus Sericytochromatia bacterium]
MRHVEREADAGSPAAMETLGRAYLGGYVRPLDVPRGLKWHERAAEAGSEGSTEIIRLARDGYGRGLPEAVFEMGERHLFGDGLAKDQNQAEELWRQAALDGHSQATDRTAMALLLGRGPEDSLAYAAWWIAANTERSGRGDLSRLLLRAADGCMDSKQRLGREALESRQGRASIREGIGRKLLTEAAKSGSASAAGYLAHQLQTGLLLPLDTSRARYWAEVAIQRGDPEGYGHLVMGYHGLRSANVLADRQAWALLERTRDLTMLPELKADFLNDLHHLPDKTVREIPDLLGEVFMGGDVGCINPVAARAFFHEGQIVGSERSTWWLDLQRGLERRDAEASAEYGAWLINRGSSMLGCNRGVECLLGAHLAGAANAWGLIADLLATYALPTQHHLTDIFLRGLPEQDGPTGDKYFDLVTAPLEVAPIPFWDRQLSAGRRPLPWNRPQLSRAARDGHMWASDFLHLVDDAERGDPDASFEVGRALADGMPGRITWRDGVDYLRVGLG